MPVRGLDSALKKTDSLTRDIAEVKAERAVSAALITGQAFAAMLTPVDTSFLINSQYRDIKKQGSKFIGAVGYTALYAAAVPNCIRQAQVSAACALRHNQGRQAVRRRDRSRALLGSVCGA